MSEPCVGGGAALSISNRSTLVGALRTLVGSVLDAMPVNTRACRWTARALVLCAVLMALEVSGTAQQRFEVALEVLDQTRGNQRKVGRTYTGLSKAQLSRGGPLLARVRNLLDELILRLAGPHGLIAGMIPIGVDSSKVECPRTAANLRVHHRAGKDKCGPQLLLAALHHLSLNLTWRWALGPADGSERGLFLGMIRHLPRAACLVVMDAGFTGFDFLNAVLSPSRHVLVRAGANVHLLTRLGYAAKERDGLVYLWPTDQRQQPPLVLRLIRLSIKGGRSMCLLTDILDERRFSDQQAAAVYNLRWGIEVAFRGLKQTLGRRKLVSDAPAQAASELHWTMVGLTLLGLIAAQALSDNGRNPAELSLAAALRTARRWLRRPARTGFLAQLGRAVRDNYVRLRPKAAHDWPHKKNPPPPGVPNVRDATDQERRQSQQFLPKIAA